jgi:subtilisin family serine protease
MFTVEREAIQRVRMLWVSLVVLAMFMLPALGAAVTPEVNPVPEEGDQPWWLTTNMDKDGDKIHDAIPIAIVSTQRDWVDEEGRIGVIVDFDHLPTEADERLLERAVDFRVQFRYHIIDSIAGSVEVVELGNLANLPGVVLVEIDGILTIQMKDVNEVHGVTNVWDDTGYTGAGSVVAIIDTGIDANHSGLDDLDDDNETYDPKVIGFYDVINRPNDVNGTDVAPYDDQGHGSHCAGITAGTGAPTFEHIGVAPQAQLVGVKVLSAAGSGSFAQVMQGMQWTIDYRHKFNIRAASMSLGGPGASEWTASEQDSTNRMANEMVRNGIALFIAAGNSAFSAQIGTPGSAEDVITVGALDKNTAIAIYSSQGPTEEGRVKPNIAFVGSNVMAPDYNTGTGYTSKSGTSMATPGAAGLAALMYQANPDLSPFDVRNIMQETATYRLCVYMGANEPCIEDLIPKNRQNNVYGHGHVNAEPAVSEAANQVYGLTLAVNVSSISPTSGDDRVHVGPGGSVDFVIIGDVQKVQWRTWDMRDYWSDHTEFEAGETNVKVTHEMLLDRLRYLPGNEITGNQTIMMRAIVGDNASTNSVVHLHVMGETAISATEETGGFSGLLVLLTSLLILLLLGLVLSVLMLKGHFSEVRTQLGLSLPAELLYEDGFEDDAEAQSAEPRNG